MSESTENEPIEEASVVGGAHKWRIRRRIRFGLLELLLLTAVIAAWLPVMFARRQIPTLETEIATMRLATLQLIVADEKKLNARSLPSIWHNINSWKYSAPPNSDLELRLATEGINSMAFPADYQAVALPEGEHSIHLKYTSGSDGHHTKVYVDHELVLQQPHGPEWLGSHGSSSTGDVANQSTVYELNKPLKLKFQRYTIDHPLKKYHTISVPEEYDNKGNILWISPRSNVPAPPSRFFTPRSKYSQEAVGHRQGIKVYRSSQRGLAGLIGIQPSLNATLGDNRRHYPYCPLGISVRPVLDDATAPEVPEQQTGPIASGQAGMTVSLRDTIATPEKRDGVAVHKTITRHAISQDGETMRTFAHFPAFKSGAKPIVEILFDAAHPDRVGFLPHAAPESAPMQACQFVTRFDARFFWRELELLPGADNEADEVDLGAKTSRVSIAQLYPELDFAKIETSTPPNTQPFSWTRISSARLPRIAATDTVAEMLLLNLITDVADSSKLTFPAGLAQKWEYEGVANRQVWWLPAPGPENKSESVISVDVRAAAVFPTTSVPLLGGPAIANVRITVPMPATQPVWLEIVAESDATK